MNDSEYGFLFKPNGNEEQGPSNSGEEIFSDDTIAQALARELGQNSLDAIAKDDAWPVTMVFELHRMKVEDIPDVNNLRRHLRAALGRYPDSPRLQEAVKTLDGECIDVLRVGDYGTKGLSGSESIADSGSVLTALTRGSGVSVGKTDAGGSFGIGKSVGILSSLVRTEFWTTRTPDSDETVFAGCTQLTTHQVPGSDDPRQLLGPMGTYTLLSDMQDYRYLRDPAPLGPFSQRTEPGTDVYIIGYSAAGDDPRLEQIRDAMIDNFMAAIMRGHLVVDGVTDKGRGWHLDSGSLKRVIDSIPDPERRTVMQAFHNALLQPPVVRNDSRLGEMKLYINIDDSLPRKLNTIVMRKPLMKVRAYTKPPSPPSTRPCWNAPRRKATASSEAWSRCVTTTGRRRATSRTARPCSVPSRSSSSRSCANVSVASSATKSPSRASIPSCRPNSKSTAIPTATASAPPTGRAANASPPHCRAVRPRPNRSPTPAASR